MCHTRLVRQGGALPNGLARGSCVESRMGAVLEAMPIAPFPSPLIEPDVPISGIPERRDQLCEQAKNRGVRACPAGQSVAKAMFLVAAVQRCLFRVKPGCPPMSAAGQLTLQLRTRWERGRQSRLVPISDIARTCNKRLPRLASLMISLSL
jgi:hypothetical protein